MNRKRQEQQKRISNDPLVQRIEFLSGHYNGKKQISFFGLFFDLVNENRQRWRIGEMPAVKAVEGVRREDNYGMGRKFDKWVLPETKLDFCELWGYFFDRSEGGILAEFRRVYGW